MKNLNIALLSGDGIGPEVVEQAVKVLRALEERTQVQFNFSPAPIGAEAINKTGNPLPEETLALCKASNAILFGAIGSPEYDRDPDAKIRPEQGLLRLRKELGLFANIRPVRTYRSLAYLSPLKEDLVRFVDFVVFRELTGGIYFGKKTVSKDGSAASDTCEYTRPEIERIARIAFSAAKSRRKKLTLVDKANVLETSRLWRRTVKEISGEYPDVETDYMYVDNAAMKLMQSPASFDVILTENMFGDILTDEASVITGSLGMLPSASMGLHTSLYEPVHGSYPEAAGKGIANPVGAILSASMMLELSFGMRKEAMIIRDAVGETIKEGMVTLDLNESNHVTTEEVGSAIAEKTGILLDVLLKQRSISMYP